jgi:hypothetical protein
MAAAWMTFRQRDMHDIVLHIVETAAQARCAIHLCTYCRKIKPLLTRTTYRKEEQVCRGADMRGGGTGGEKERGVLLVPVLWAGRGFSRIPRTFLPHAHPQRKKERRTDRKQDWSRRSYRLHGALFTERLIPPLLVPSFALLNVLFRTVAFALDYYYRRRIAIFMGTK